MPDGTPPNNPFLIDANLTLAEIIERVEQTGQPISKTRRRDILSDLNTIARLIGRPASSIPASIEGLREALASIHPAQAGISKKRLANIRSNLSMALDIAGVSQSSPMRKIELSEVWQSLLDNCSIQRVRWDLNRFARFCSGCGVDPEQVTDTIADQFLTAMNEAAIWKVPEETHRTTINRWNEAVKKVSGWPNIVLTKPPSRRNCWTFPLTEFPQSFNDDLDRWSERAISDDLFDDDAPPTPLRPKTVEHRRFQVRMAASALVLRSVPIEQVTTLAVLVQPENLKLILRFMIDRLGGKTESIYGLANGLVAIAQHHVKVDGDTLDELKRIRKKVKVKPVGLRKKNRRRLAQFDDPHNVALLLNLPDRLARLAEKQPGRKAAVTMQLAVAIEILIMAPLRIGNLSTLRVGKEIYWSRPGNTGVLQIMIEDNQVKNRMHIEHELPKESERLIKTYIENYRDRLYPDCGDWLFPGKAGQAKRSNGFSEQVKKIIHRHTGLTVNAHLMRSTGGKLYLSVFPGAYELLSRVLVHSVQATMDSYTGTEAKAAGIHFDRVISGLRDGTRTSTKVRLNKRR